MKSNNKTLNFEKKSIIELNNDESLAVNGGTSDFLPITISVSLPPYKTLPGTSTGTIYVS